MGKTIIGEIILGKEKEIRGYFIYIVRTENV